MSKIIMDMKLSDLAQQCQDAYAFCDLLPSGVQISFKRASSGKVKKSSYCFSWRELKGASSEDFSEKLAYLKGLL